MVKASEAWRMLVEVRDARWRRLRLAGSDQLMAFVWPGRSEALAFGAQVAQQEQLQLLQVALETAIASLAPD